MNKMRYIQRPGIVKTEICGVSYLIPTRIASEECPRVLKLSLITAIAWEAVGKNKEQDIYKVYGILSKKSEEEVQEKVEELLRGLSEKGFLIEAEDDKE